MLERQKQEQRAREEARRRAEMLEVQAADDERRAAVTARLMRRAGLESAESKAASARQSTSAVRQLLFGHDDRVDMEDLRRAIISAEVFGRPVGDR